MSQTEQTAQFLGALLAATIAGFVAADAKRRGLPPKSILGWGAGVFFLLILFLPLYLWARQKEFQAPTKAQELNQNSTAACPYCEYLNAQGADYCGKCGRQLKKSTEIHR